MTRSELCDRVAAATSLSKADASAAAGAVFSNIADALARGETASIAGFGSTGGLKDFGPLHDPAGGDVRVPLFMRAGSPRTRGPCSSCA